MGAAGHSVYLPHALPTNSSHHSLRLWCWSLFCVNSPSGKRDSGVRTIYSFGRNLQRSTDTLSLFWKQGVPNTVCWSQLAKNKGLSNMGLAFFLGSHSSMELDMQVRREALRKCKGKDRCGGSKRRKQCWEIKQQALQPRERPHSSRLCPSRKTCVLEGDKERDGERTEGKEERSGREKKKSTKQALDRYSKANNVLKTTC